VVIVNPGGTGRPIRLISASPAPFPPRRSRIDASPSSKRRVHRPDRFAVLRFAAGFTAARPFLGTSRFVARFIAFAITHLESEFGDWDMQQEKRNPHTEMRRRLRSMANQDT